MVVDAVLFEPVSPWNFSAYRKINREAQQKGSYWYDCGRESTKIK